MIFVFDPNTRKCTHMVRPYTMIFNDDHSIFVTDVNGYVSLLKFSSRDLLRCAMDDLFDSGRCKAVCEFEWLRNEKENIGNDDHDRELDFIEDLEVEIER